MKQIALTVIGFGLLSACGSPGQVPPVSEASPANPTANIDKLTRWMMEDLERRRAEEQRERVRKAQEEAYDREMCVKAGMRGPDIDQCVRDSGLL